MHRDRRGTAALEFVAAGSVILLLVLAVFNVGLLYLTQRGLDYGLYQAARWAAVNSASVSPATVLAQFKAATSVTLGSASSNCQAYASGTSAPAGTACAVTLSLSNGAAVGSVMTIQATFNWTPVAPVTGFVAATLQSSIALTIQN